MLGKEIHTGLYSKEAFLFLRGVYYVAQWDTVTHYVGLQPLRSQETVILREADNETVVTPYFNGFDNDEINNFTNPIKRLADLIIEVFDTCQFNYQKASAFFFTKDSLATASEKKMNRGYLNDYIVGFTSSRKSLLDRSRYSHGYFETSERAKIKKMSEDLHAYDHPEYWLEVRVSLQHWMNKMTEKKVDVHLGFISCLIDFLYGLNENELIERHGEKTYKMLIGEPADPFTSVGVENEKEELVTEASKLVHELLDINTKMLADEGEELKRIVEKYLAENLKVKEAYAQKFKNLAEKHKALIKNTGDIPGYPSREFIKEKLEDFERESTHVLDEANTFISIPPFVKEWL